MSGRKNKGIFVLDSFAILTYLQEEPGWQKVSTLLLDAAKNKNTIFLNYINLGEIYYIIYREYGAVKADQAINLIKLWPIRLIDVKEDLAIIAGRMKAENKISYADAFVVATALNKKAAIVTGDPEFKSIEEFINIQWLPPNH